MTETREIDLESLTEALALIDRGLGDLQHRELVSTAEVADLLGHKDLEMVVKRYRHRTEGVVKSHVAVLGSLMADTR